MNHVILVVEDDPSSRELMADWLHTEGYDAVTCADLSSAKAAIQSRPPGLVLLDVKLAGENGLDLARWMHDDPRLQSIPVIAVTAHAMLVEREKVFQAGCVACVSKPVDFAQLGIGIRQWLAGSSPGSAVT